MKNKQEMINRLNETLDLMENTEGDTPQMFMYIAEVDALSWILGDACIAAIRRKRMALLDEKQTRLGE